jgi:hypothetical protein
MVVYHWLWVAQRGEYAKRLQMNLLLHHWVKPLTPAPVPVPPQ